jgi:hypothetical protein
MSATLNAAWDDLLQALDFAEGVFERWRERQVIGDQQAAVIAEDYRALRRQWEETRADGKPPPDVGLPPPEVVPDAVRDDARRQRFWAFVGREVERHRSAGRLWLPQAHACQDEVRGRRAALRRRIDLETAPEALPVDEPARPPAPPRRPVLEALLDPKNIQRLLAFGGLLLVAGLVIYLYASGIFENPVVVAVLLGAATVGVLATGFALIRLTRYQTAGRALALLACLVMPLNLWFYDSQRLYPLTLYELLWVPALVCCAVYAAAAAVLRDGLFVYVFVGGVTLTSLLLLGNVDGPERFWQVTHPAILLSVLGLLTLHVERAFPDAADGEFTRRRFGLPFFRSGHVVLAAGLLLVAGAQLYGFVFHAYPDGFAAAGYPSPAPLTSELPLKVLALLLVLAGTYAYVYSDVVVRRVGLFLYPAVLTLLWAELLVIDLLNLKVTAELAIVVLASNALAVNLFVPVAGRLAPAGTPALARAGQVFGVLLSTVPVLLGVGVLLVAMSTAHLPDGYHLGWEYVGAVALAAVACRVGAHQYRLTQPGLAATYFFGTMAATLVGAAGLLAVLGLHTWQAQAPLLMVLPILYLAAAWLYAGRPAERPLVWVAHAATAVMLASSLVAGTAVGGQVESGAADPVLVRGFLLVRGEALNLSLAGFFAEAALFYALAAALRRQLFPTYLATAAACAAAWQLLNYASVPDVWYVLAFAAAGLALLVCYRFLVLAALRVPGLEATAFACANALLSVSFVAGALLALAHLAAGAQEAEGRLLGMMGALIAVGLVAVWLVRDPGWRSWYVVATVGEAILTLLAFAVLSDLTAWQKLEVVGVILGGGLLVLGHLGWAREQEQQSGLVGLALVLGSVLMALPVTVAVIVYRHANEFHWPDELGTLAMGIVLFATGSMFRLRATTLTGAVQLLLWVGTLLIYLPWSQVNTAAVCLMVGGGGVFVVGLLLSVYRDRLLALPDKIKRREGVFRVLSWR